MGWTDYGWEDDPSAATPLDAEKLEDFGEHVHDNAAATAATAAGTALTAHTGDATAAHAASAISFAPTGTIAGTDVQAAVAEVASERVSADAALDARVTTLETSTGGIDALTTLVNISADRTAAVGDVIFVDATNGNVTITLPTTPTALSRVLVKKVDTSDNIVTILPHGSGLIDRASSYVITVANGSATFQCLASDTWKIVSDVSPQSAQSGSGAILPWVTGTAYAQGQPVTNSGHTYTANDAHTAGATFAGDLASHWTLLPIAKADVGLGNVANAAAIAATALDVDATLAANSDTRVPSQKAVKTYVDGHAGSASEATTTALGTVKVASPPRTGENARVAIQRQTADRWVRKRAVTTKFAGDATKSVTGVASTGVFTANGHGYAAGDLVIFALASGGSGLTAGVPYYVLAPTTNTFTVALAPGGTAVTFATDLVTGTVQRMPDGYMFDISGMKYVTSYEYDASKSVTGVASTDIFTAAAHGYVAGDIVVFAGISGGAGITSGKLYFVIASNLTTNTFSVSATSGGGSINFTTDLTAGTVQRQNTTARTAIQAADGGTATPASFLTKVKDFKNWEIVGRYQPNNDATTSSTDYGVQLYGAYQDANNTWIALEAHASGNPAVSLLTKLAGSTQSGQISGATAAVSPLAVTVDRIVKFAKQGDLLLWKDWPANTVEPDWQARGRAGALNAVDVPEWGALGIGGANFNGAKWLELKCFETERQSGQMLWNTDFSRLDCAPLALGQIATADQVVGVSGGVAGTGVFTTTAAHGYSVGERVVFFGFNGGAGASQPADVGITSGMSYYVAAVPTSTTFTVATTRGGSAITFSNNMGAAYVARNPPPAWWTRPRQGLLSSGNAIEVIHTAGPDGSIRPALRILVATPNDVNAKWTQTVYDISRSSVAPGGFGGVMRPYPQFETARRMEAGFWVKGSTANIGANSLGLAMDIYMFDVNGAVLFMDRATYHPGLTPTTAADPTLGGGNSIDVASYDGFQTDSTFGWTYMTSIVECEMWESVYFMRCDYLLHDSTMTCDVAIMDPCLRAVG